MEYQIFDLEKIKEIFSSLEKLQGNLSKIEELHDKYSIEQNSLINSIENLEISDQIELLSKIIDGLSDKLKTILNHNIISFLSLKEEFIHNYKQSYIENLKEKEINKELTKKIGLELIEEKFLSRIIKTPTYVNSISVSQWIELIDALKENSIFVELVHKLSIYYQKIIKNRLDDELNNIPKNTDKILLTEFEKSFHRNPNLTFKQFLIEYEDKKSDSQSKKEYIRKRKQREELEQLKKKQEQQQEEYEDYFKFSDQEFDRRRRRKSREKLENLKKDKKSSAKIEISEEVSEKIEKFKSQFEKKFENDYLIDQTEERDPLELIRERKSKKKKEFDTYKEHFDDIN